jgi:hypothetical protein
LPSLRRWFFRPASTPATVFSDNFDSDPLGLNAVPAGWTIGNDGTVDVIGNPGFYDLIPGNGRDIDLDGSTGAAGLLETSFAVTAGLTYTATFQLGGNHRDGNSDSVAVVFGGSTLTPTLASATASPPSVSRRRPRAIP